MPLINCKWDPNCILTSLDGALTFTITDPICSNCNVMNRRQCKIIKTIK